MNGKLKDIISSIFIILICAGCKTTKFVNTINAGTLENKNFYFSVPYQPTQGDAGVVTVVIKGKKRRFMVDTGAPLIISKALQRECNFSLFYQSKLVDANNDTSGVTIV